MKSTPRKARSPCRCLDLVETPVRSSNSTAQGYMLYDLMRASDDRVTEANHFELRRLQPLRHYLPDRGRCNLSATWKESASHDQCPDPLSILPGPFPYRTNNRTCSDSGLNLEWSSRVGFFSGDRKVDGCKHRGNYVLVFPALQITDLQLQRREGSSHR